MISKHLLDESEGCGKSFGYSNRARNNGFKKKELMRKGIKAQRANLLLPIPFSFLQRHSDTLFFF